MNRREFARASTAVGITAGLGSSADPSASRPSSGAFKLRYAPHFGMFEAHAGKDLIDQIKFMADQGFGALEDNWLSRRPAEQQVAIGKALRERDMLMGVFVAHADFRKVTFASDKKSMREDLVKQMKAAVEVAKRVGAQWCTVVPGRFHSKLEWDYQTANVIDNLRACAEVCEKGKLIMVLEPLNPYRDHPGLFLTKVSQGYLVCRGVNSPSCKILDDLYHQQITEGNLIPNMDKGWSEIAYIQVGDHPGRKEPGTGEINYRNVFKHIHSKGYQGVIGMEHGKSQGGIEGEKKLIAAYRDADGF